MFIRAIKNTRVNIQQKWMTQGSREMQKNTNLPRAKEQKADLLKHECSIVLQHSKRFEEHTLSPKQMKCNNQPDIFIEMSPVDEIRFNKTNLFLGSTIFKMNVSTVETFNRKWFNAYRKF